MAKNKTKVYRTDFGEFFSLQYLYSAQSQILYRFKIQIVKNVCSNLLKHPLPTLVIPDSAPPPLNIWIYIYQNNIWNSNLFGRWPPLPPIFWNFDLHVKDLERVVPETPPPPPPLPGNTRRRGGSVWPHAPRQKLNGRGMGGQRPDKCKALIL